MTSYAAPDVVDGAPREPYRYGLFSVVPLRSDASAHWEAGVTWSGLSCAPVSGLAMDCSITPSKNFASSVKIGNATGFLVYGTHKCSPVGISLQEAQSRAVLLLQAREEYRAEQAFWTGDLGNTPNLVTGAVTLGGGAVAPEVALALLEDWIADNYGSLGVIHVTRGAALALIAAKLVERDGGVLRTLIGTPVVAAAGYPGTSPAGANPAAGTSWGFVSPAVFGYRSEVFDATSRVGDLLNRATNDMYAIAERIYLLGFDNCGTAAVNFNLT